MKVLEKLLDSPREGKRYRAVINFKNKRYNVDFGSSNHESYPMHKDPERKIRYVKRHLKDLNKTFTKITPGILAMLILWGFSTVSKSVKNFNKQMQSGVVKVDPELYDKIHRQLKNQKRKLGETGWDKTWSMKLKSMYEKQFKEKYGSKKAYINFA